MALALDVPQSDRGVETAADEHGVVLGTENGAFDAPGVPGVALECLGGGDVPEEDGFVAAGGDEARVIAGDGDGEDFVAVDAGVALDGRCGCWDWFGRVRGDGGGVGWWREGFEGVPEVDGAVGGAT